MTTDRPLAQNTKTRRTFLAGAATAGVLSAIGPARGDANATLRIAISLLDIPRLWGSPDGGFEGLRFGGYPIFDALVNWDLRNETSARLAPGLAKSWQVDPADKRRWIIQLRENVLFHDGSRFDADAAIWNFDSMLDRKAPQYDAVRAGMTRPRMPSIVKVEKLGDGAVAVLTDAPDAITPYQFSFLLMVSPSHFAALGNDWIKFAATPSGTGPFRVTQLVPRTRLELARNEHYWDPARIPKAATLTMLPIPDANSRVAALRSGQVDFIESVPPDAIASLKSSGLTVLGNLYPHMWGWRLSTLPDSPFADLRVRRAVNLGIDRDAIVQMLSGTAVPARGLVEPSSPWFGRPRFDVRFDPIEARKLMSDAGFGPGRRLKAQVLISNSGGGQMQPLPMNELIQQNLSEIGIDIEYKVVDFITLFTAYRNGAKAPASAGVSAINLASPTQEPSSSILRGFLSDFAPPRGTNWDYYANPEMDRLLRVAREEFEPAAFDQAMARAHEHIVDNATCLFVVHDTNPRALSRRLHGFIQPRNWFADFTSISVG
jgi:peptide/nickel transport system substrate-binding protein